MPDDNLRPAEVMLSELATFEPGSCWLTYGQAAVALGITERQVAADTTLIVGAKRHPTGELMLDAADVVRHARKHRAPTIEREAAQGADVWLAEMRQQGLDVDIFGGDDAA